MKKIVSILLVLTLCFALGGCEKEPADPFGVDSYKWEFSHVQDETGAFVYCAESNTSLYPDAQVLAVECRVKDGAIHLESNGQSWTLPYSEYMEGPSGTIYSLETSDGSVALAQVSLTEYDDGTSQYTLTVAADTYALYFYEK